MPEALRRAISVACAIFACALAPATARAADLPPGAGNGVPTALPAGCVAKLVDLHANGYASHYVTDRAYAYGEWRASGYGGQSLWARRGTAWCKVATGLTILDRRELARFGVSSSAARRLLAMMHASAELAPPVLRDARDARLAGHAGAHRAQR